jgi:hypothetical protein
VPGRSPDHDRRSRPAGILALQVGKAGLEGQLDFRMSTRVRATIYPSILIVIDTDYQPGISFFR